MVGNCLNGNWEPLNEALGKPYDPVCMLRALILMVLLQKDSIPKFVSKLKESHRMAITAGFEPDDVPATGTFYLFIDRLEDGEYHPPIIEIEFRIKEFTKQSKFTEF